MTITPFASRAAIFTVRSGGAGGRNYGSVGGSSLPFTIEAAVAIGEVALFSWIRTGALGDEPPVEIGGDATGVNWVEITNQDGQGIGQGWLTGNGVCSFHLNASGSMSVDVDPGEAFVKEES